MLENSLASNSWVFIGVLSKFPKLKRSVLRIAGQRFIRWIRVIRSLGNLCLKCNHCISIFRACIELPPIWREEETFEKFVHKLMSWNLLTSVLTSYAKKNSSFAERNESSDASEAKDFRIVQILFGGFAVDGRHLESKHKETRLRWASDVTSYILNCAITQEHVFSNGGHILRDFGAKNY